MNKSHRSGAEEWRQIIDGRQTSGLSVAAYCQERGITQGSFYTWKRRLRSPAMPSRLPGPSFVEVTPPRAETAGTIEICLRGDPFRHDQHLPPAQHRYAALPDPVVDEPAGDVHQPDRAMAARQLEEAKSGSVRVDPVRRVHRSPKAIVFCERKTGQALIASGTISGGASLPSTL